MREVQIMITIMTCLTSHLDSNSPEVWIIVLESQDYNSEPSVSTECSYLDALL